MGDRKSFDLILRATRPKDDKKLGRRVDGWDEGLWQRSVCTVALEAVTQKFTNVASIRGVLLKTRDALIAEATRSDCNWGIGLDIGDPRIQDPRQWKGANILGWALMEARSILRSSQSASPPGGGISHPSPVLSTTERDNEEVLRYWLVMDFEATCEDGDRRWKNEIIEWPCVLVDCDTLQVVDEFRSMVRPTENPKLTAFCTQLTSITQDQVDSAPTLPEVLQSFDAWLSSHGVSEQGALSVWCGDWDLNTCLPRECVRKGIQGLVPPVLKSWCNVKVAYGDVMGAKAKGMDGMLRGLRIPLEGHHHLGIDDARNIAKIVTHLASRGGTGCIRPTAHSSDVSIYRRRAYAGSSSSSSSSSRRPPH